tara:strand:- start:5353 stop:5937 length:585 start_codon:yes stop_codon:yes gene_type:complete
MSSTLKAHKIHQEKIVEDAINLLSQQIWCWGKDIEKSEGNWLLEIGFSRLELPADREGSSVYLLKISENKCIYLRAFGILYVDTKYGSIFLPRYEFLPEYTEESTLDKPPWTKKDLPKLKVPTKSQKNNCDSLMLDLLMWIRNYEENIVHKLGIEYREETLIDWDNGRRIVIPAQQIISQWKIIESAVLDNKLG